MGPNFFAKKSVEDIDFMERFQERQRQKLLAELLEKRRMQGPSESYRKTEESRQKESVLIDVHREPLENE